MKTCSFRVLLKIPELAGFSEVQLLHPSADVVVHKYLAMMGMDVEYPVEYFFSNHRDAFNKVEYGYQARAETSINRHDINGPFGDLTDRLVASNFQDPSLTAELEELSLKSLDYLKYVEYEIIEVANRFPDALEENWQEKEQWINDMNALIIKIRGSAYNASGALKVREEYDDAS